MIADIPQLKKRLDVVEISLNQLIIEANEQSTVLDDLLDKYDNAVSHTCFIQLEYLKIMLFNVF